MCFSNVGQPGRAMGYWHRALDLAEKAPGRDRFVRMVHNNLGLAYLKVGDYDAARASLEKEKGLIDTTFEAYRGPSTSKERSGTTSRPWSTRWPGIRTKPSKNRLRRSGSSPRARRARHRLTISLISRPGTRWPRQDGSKTRSPSMQNEGTGRGTPSRPPARWRLSGASGLSRPAPGISRRLGRHSLPPSISLVSRPFLRRAIWPDVAGPGRGGD